MHFIYSYSTNQIQLPETTNPKKSINEGKGWEAKNQFPNVDISYYYFCNQSFLLDILLDFLRKLK